MGQRAEAVYADFAAAQPPPSPWRSRLPAPPWLAAALLIAAVLAAS